MILIIDDKEEILELLSMSLNIKHIEHETCLTGKEALEKIKTNDYSIIVLDLHLANESGYCICEEIRKIKPNQKVIACSGFIDEKRLKCFNGWIEKPFTHQEFINEIRR